VDILTKDAKSRLKSNIVRFKETNDAESSNKENRDGHRGDNDIQGRGKRSVVLQDQTRVCILLLKICNGNCLWIFAEQNDKRR